MRSKSYASTKYTNMVYNLNNNGSINIQLIKRLLANWSVNSAVTAIIR